MQTILQWKSWKKLTEVSVEAGQLYSVAVLVSYNTDSVQYSAQDIYLLLCTLTQGAVLTIINCSDNIPENN